MVVACNGTVSCAPDSDTSSEVTVGEHADGGSTTQHTSPSAVVHSGLLDCSRREGDQHELVAGVFAGRRCLQMPASHIEGEWPQGMRRWWRAPRMP